MQLMTSLVPIYYLTANIHNSSGYAGGAAQISQENAINDKSHPNLATNIHNSSGYAGDAAQISQANTIDDKSCPNLTTNIHNYSGYAGGAAQISQANAINDKSHPNSSTKLMTSLVPIIPQTSLILSSQINHKHPQFFRLRRRRCPNFTGKHN
jgi:hypothetical protein